MKHRTIEQLAGEVAAGQHDVTIADIAALIDRNGADWDTRRLVLAVVCAFLDANIEHRTETDYRRVRRCRWCNRAGLDYTNPAKPYCHSCMQPQT